MKDTIHNTRQLADKAIDAVDDKVHDLRARSVPALDRAGEQAASWADRGAQQLRQGSRQVRASAHEAAAEARQYVHEQPLKSVLIAAGAGALLMGVISLLAHRRSGRRG